MTSSYQTTSEESEILFDGARARPGSPSVPCAPGARVGSPLTMTVLAKATLQCTFAFFTDETHPLPLGGLLVMVVPPDPPSEHPIPPLAPVYQGPDVPAKQQLSLQVDNSARQRLLGWDLELEHIEEPDEMHFTQVQLTAVAPEEGQDPYCSIDADPWHWEVEGSESPEDPRLLTLSITQREGPAPLPNGIEWTTALPGCTLAGGASPAVKIKVPRTGPGTVVP